MTRRRATNPAERPRPHASEALGEDEIVGLQAAAEGVIYRHVFECSDREVGGVLIGRLAVDGRLPLVTGAIPAISADEQRATLTFTQEAWAHVHRVLESDFPPDEQIVGWYHSHPGFGIFLSGHDLFIHENFFSAPSQIAVVVDPHGCREGAFAWREGKLISLYERATPSEWIATQPSGPAAWEHTAKPRVARSEGPREDGYPLLAHVLAAVIGLAIGFGLWSLAEHGGTTQPPLKAKPAPAKAHHTRTAPATPENHIEVLGG
jgi:proteasome lid subunit RPN8/RPN11